MKKIQLTLMILLNMFLLHIIAIICILLNTQENIFVFIYIFGIYLLSEIKKIQYFMKIIDDIKNTTFTIYILSIYSMFLLYLSFLRPDFVVEYEQYLISVFTF